MHRCIVAEGINLFVNLVAILRLLSEEEHLAARRVRVRRRPRVHERPERDQHALRGVLVVLVGVLLGGGGSEVIERGTGVGDGVGKGRVRPLHLAPASNGRVATCRARAVAGRRNL